MTDVTQTSESATQETLLPCPCCGGGAELRGLGLSLPTTIELTGKVWRVVRCTVCKLTTDLLSDEDGQAVAIWNRRTLLGDAP